MTEYTLWVTVGLPYSGKTTWARSLGFPIVNPDSIRYALHGQRFCMSAEPYVWAIAQTMVWALFLAGHKQIVLDATNCTRKRRQMWQSVRWVTKWKVFDVSRDECLRRAVDDDEIHPVIERMAREFEPLVEDEMEGGPK